MMLFMKHEGEMLICSEWKVHVRDENANDTTFLPLLVNLDFLCSGSSAEQLKITFWTVNASGANSSHRFPVSELFHLMPLHRVEHKDFKV